MMNSKLTTASLAELIDAYRVAAASHGVATEGDDYEQANEMADRVANIYSELRRRGPTAQTNLLSLLADEAAGARLWSASHALEFAPQEGERVLEALVSAGTLLGFSAEMTLKEWRAGRLRFP
jgi:hypothetical protein